MSEYRVGQIVEDIPGVPGKWELVDKINACVSPTEYEYWRCKAVSEDAHALDSVSFWWLIVDGEAARAIEYQTTEKTMEDYKIIKVIDHGKMPGGHNMHSVSPIDGCGNEHPPRGMPGGCLGSFEDFDKGREVTVENYRKKVETLEQALYSTQEEHAAALVEIDSLQERISELENLEYENQKLREENASYRQGTFIGDGSTSQQHSPWNDAVDDMTNEELAHFRSGDVIGDHPYSPCRLVQFFGFYNGHERWSVEGNINEAFYAPHFCSDKHLILERDGVPTNEGIKRLAEEAGFMFIYNNKIMFDDDFIGIDFGIKEVFLCGDPDKQQRCDVTYVLNSLLNM